MKHLSRRIKESVPMNFSVAELTRKYPDLINLSIGDTDFTTDSRIIASAFQDAENGYTHYGDPQGDPELIAAVMNAWREDFGQELDKKNVLITASSCLGMGLLMLALIDPGDEVIVFGPYFSVYRSQIELAGGVCVEVPTKAEDGWAIHKDALDAAVTVRTKAVILDNPSNPTGAVYTRESLQALADVAQKHDLLVLADEIYTKYLFSGSFIPFSTLPGMKERTVTLNSFSKNFMMTGWRVGVLIAPEPIRAAVQAVNSGMIYSAPSVSQRAALKALEIRGEMDRLYIHTYQQRVLDAAEQIRSIPYMRLAPVQGTFYLFPDVSQSGVSDQEFCRLALEQAHVLVLPGSEFGQAGQGHIRLACTVPGPEIREALCRLASMRFS